MQFLSNKNRALFWGIAFFSGVAGLIYEVLWFREFALLLGNTAQASALVLAVIFFGLALGNHLGGRWSKTVLKPLRAYALLELLMACCSIFIVLFKNQEGVLGLLPLFLLLAVVAILMGATLPLLLQSLPEVPDKLGRETPMLYGMNTLGGMVGAACAGLFFPLWLGVKGSFLLAIFINLILTALCGTMSFFMASKRQKNTESVMPSNGDSYAISPLLLGLAAFSGMGTLALEVLWTRMFSLVLQNSVYGFALILVLILFALAVAALVVDGLVKRGHDPLGLMRSCLLIVAISIPLGALFFVQTSGLQSLFKEIGPIAYLFKMLTVITVLLLPTMIAAGMILPLAWTLHRQSNETAGRVLGRFMSFNTVGGVGGSLLAGFFLLPHLGLWSALALVSLCYAVAAIVLTRSFSEKPRRQGIFGFTSAALLLPILLFFPAFSTQHLKAGESLLYLDQGAEAQVAVIQRQNGSRVLKVNNTYSLGSTSAEIEERRMGQIPLLLHPSPKRVAFVGLATGITASAIFDHPVEEVKLIELLPEVVKGAAWFEKENRGLLDDPRSEVIIADGRIAVPSGGARFDLIISDLFVPWHAGATSLYSLNYYKQAAKQLAQGGAYAQWLPLYQMSEREFKIIGQTFLKVFPHVSLWRGNFSTKYPLVALIGSEQAISIDRSRLAQRLEGINDGPATSDPSLSSVDDLMLLFGGKGKKLGALFSGAKVNSDDRPYIEYLAPLSRLIKNQLRGEDLASLFFEVAESNITDEIHDWQNYALAGAHLYQAEVASDLKDLDQRIVALNSANDLVDGGSRLSQIDRALRVSGFLNH